MYEGTFIFCLRGGPSGLHQNESLETLQPPNRLRQERYGRTLAHNDELIESSRVSFNERLGEGGVDVGEAEGAKAGGSWRERMVGAEVEASEGGKGSDRFEERIALRERAMKTCGEGDVLEAREERGEGEEVIGREAIKLTLGEGEGGCGEEGETPPATREEGEDGEAIAVMVGGEDEDEELVWQALKGIHKLRELGTLK